MLTPHQINRLNFLINSKRYYDMDREFYRSFTGWADKSYGGKDKHIMYNNRTENIKISVVVSFSRYRDWILGTGNTGDK